MEIKAAVVFQKSGKFSVEKVEISDPNDNEVLVRIVGAGICHTDLAGRDLHLPIPPARALPQIISQHPLITGAHPARASPAEYFRT